MMAESLPNWGPARPMSEAPRDGGDCVVLQDQAGGFSVLWWYAPSPPRRKGWVSELSSAVRFDGPLPEQTR